MQQQILLAATLQAAAVGVYLRQGPLCQADLPVAKDLQEKQAWRQIIDEEMPSTWDGEFSDPDVVKSAEKFKKKDEWLRGCEEDTYGEIKSSSVLELFSLVHLTTNDTFGDLGSGLGKLPIQAAALGGAGRAFGVELSTKRHALACKGLKKVESALQAKLGSEFRRKVNVQLIHGNMLEKDLSRTSVIFVNGVCIREPLLRNLGQKFARELSKNTRVGMTWSEVTYHRKPEALPSTLVEKDQERLMVSWGGGHAVHVLHVV